MLINKILRVNLIVNGNFIKPLIMLIHIRFMI